MNSLFIRNFVIYALVICLGFGILGSAFVYRVNRFALEEKQAQLTDAADRAVQSTSTYFELEGSDDWKDKFNTSYRVSMHMIAKDCDGTILVGGRDGDLLFIATTVFSCRLPRWRPFCRREATRRAPISMAFWQRSIMSWAERWRMGEKFWAWCLPASLLSPPSSCF